MQRHISQLLLQRQVFIQSQAALQHQGGDAHGFDGFRHGAQPVVEILNDLAVLCGLLLGLGGVAGVGNELCLGIRDDEVAVAAGEAAVVPTIFIGGKERAVQALVRQVFPDPGQAAAIGFF